MPRKPRPWFRFYVEAVSDRKLRRLKPEIRWLFVACLAAARTSPEPGVLLVAANDPMSADDLADWAGMDLKAVVLGMAALVTAGAVDVELERYPREAWFVPAWAARQFESDDVTVRTAKHRSKERSNDVGRNTSEQNRAEQTPIEPPSEETHVDFRHHDVPAIPTDKVELARQQLEQLKNRRGLSVVSAPPPNDAPACLTARVTDRDAPASQLRPSQAEPQGREDRGGAA